ncbi:MAG TPA: hypothetical protein PK771_13375, partial [Spirochaetota bacterium]|nr:hypothetical protein [Spirochaetota bacterium]
MSSMTHDEAVSYLRFIDKSIFSLLDFKDAGNHFINTVIGRVNATLFGKSEFSLRLGGGLAFLVYAFFSILLLKEIDSLFYRITGFIILVFNSFVLDYFSLFRGYSFVLAFTMPSIYFIIIYFIKNYNPKYLFWSLFFGFLTVLSNLSSLNYYLALCSGLLFILILKNKPEISFKNKFLFNDKSHYKLFYKRFILVSIFLSILFLPYNTIYDEVYNKMSSPIKCDIKFVDNKEHPIKVFRSSPRNGDLTEFKKIGFNQYEYNEKYSAYLYFEINEMALSTIDRVEITILDKNFIYNKNDFVAKWKLNEYLGRNLYRSPDDLVYSKSKIRQFNSFINWRSDDYLIKKVISFKVIPF